MKIKTFRFLASSSDIDEKINIFLNENVNELIDVKINTIDVQYHANGGYNNIFLLYTIVYK